MNRPSVNRQFDDIVAKMFLARAGEYKDSNAAITVTFQVTDACNLACSYCYQINKHNNRMSWDTARKIVDWLLAADESNPYINPVKNPGIILEFIGGEPFLNIDLIDKISAYFMEQAIKLNHPWKNCFRFSICSNGVLYFDARVQKYLNKWKESLSFSISIDGNKELHDACRVFPDGKGSYDVAIDGVNHYVNVMGGYMGSKMTIAPANVQYVYDAVKNLIEVGYKDINLNCVYEQGWTYDHATILYDQLKQIADYILENDLADKIFVSMFTENLGHPKNESDNQNWCGGNGRMIAFDWRGDIYPCIRYMESSLGNEAEPYCLGNIDTGFLATPEQIQKNKCLQCITRKSQSTEECFHCPIAEGCAWCTALNYQEFGTPDSRATYICPMHKARVLANVYFWNMLYLCCGDKSEYWNVFHNYMPDEWALEIIGSDELEFLKILEERYYVDSKI